MSLSHRSQCSLYPQSLQEQLQAVGRVEKVVRAVGLERGGQAFGEGSHGERLQLVATLC